MDARLLIVDDEAIALGNLQHVMEKEGYQVTATQSGAAAVALLGKQPFDVVLTDLRMQGVDGMDVLKASRERQPEAEVIFITGFATAESAVQALKHGAFYYIAKPFRLDEVRKVVAEALAKVHLRRENADLRREVEQYRDGDGIVTQDVEMQRLLDMAKQIAPTDCSVLITGESGTGKELFAKYLHKQSRRADGPYTAINCGAFSEQLLTNELFGHEKGAFTGAGNLKKGLIEASAGGTLFLDEVTEMAPAMQVKLLRVLQEKEVLRVGGTRAIKSDVRVLAATNRDVAEAIKHGSLREDLYFRLNVVNLRIPPLARRTGDIPLLAQHFLQKYASRMKKPVTRISGEVLTRLMEYPFPGNVRELENLIERGTAMAQGDTIELVHLPENFQQPLAHGVEKIQGRLPTLEEQEQTYINHVLDEVKGNQTVAAQILGINRASLWRKLKAWRGETPDA
ncbi:MAG TPA: sigma-54 dependent transcriptional regulator [Thiobacillus sp.]|nr:MAG: Fis family transcriptional regulator [Hydrogenophilales bacterium 28-61-11]OYZ57318.1 MAG: Fis family transcriptional regulator [Hydrogenophilales bacterium 16-61-112]OZA50384.1 MAG: Fis family transcriptional regulator [Hydrogenophilales bacterium 17-61-76]HQT31760.1 sigma-54 dependent transcriptional regulator [Thiobacillus sp.]HQT70306.1 sigma-54 dependent transcriptional regulator [Thiobacillus sp.]